ncbi:hypothetical protein K8R03_04795 [Candidatus Kaiserbacteria bacterium]|nr:hypothetical protein [Candidatus Kaiserbacteria bacterium]
MKNRLKARFAELQKGENLIPMLLAIAITGIALFDSNYLHNELLTVMFVLASLLFIVLLSVIFAYAGYIVLKSLFLLSAELSLLIFLAQEYCNTGVHTGDDALRSLVALSILYILYVFFKSLWTALVKEKDNIPDKQWTKEGIIIIGFFLISVISLLWMIYQVASPIILGLCVYRI